MLGDGNTKRWRAWLPRPRGPISAAQGGGHVRDGGDVHPGCSLRNGLRQHLFRLLNSAARHSRMMKLWFYRSPGNLGFARGHGRGAARQFIRGQRWRPWRFSHPCRLSGEWRWAGGVARLPSAGHLAARAGGAGLLTGRRVHILTSAGLPGSEPGPGIRGAVISLDRKGIFGWLGSPRRPRHNAE